MWRTYCSGIDRCLPPSTTYAYKYELSSYSTLRSVVQVEEWMDTILLLHLGDVGVGVGERSAHGSVHPTRPCPLLGHCNVDREGGRAAGLREKQGLDLTKSRSSRVLNLKSRAWI